jgi:hypothetical protein
MVPGDKQRRRAFCAKLRTFAIFGATGRAKHGFSPQSEASLITHFLLKVTRRLVASDEAKSTELLAHVAA